MSNSNKKVLPSTLGNMIIAMVAVAAFSGAILGFSYKITKAPIEEAKNARKSAAVLEVVPGEFDNDPFQDRIEIGKSGIELYPARQGSKITSIAVKTYSNNGFSGRIELIVGFLLDGTITGYKVIEQKETPGLGTKVTESKFANQFMGMNPKRSNFKVKQDGGEIDAVTSATISSRAIVDAIKRAYKNYTRFSTMTDEEEE